MTINDQSDTTITAPAEMIDELLDPPTDWQDQVKAQAARDYLSAVAVEAADALVEMTILVGQNAPGTPGVAFHGTAQMERLNTSWIELDRAWGWYTYRTQREDAGAVIYAACEFHAGVQIAMLVGRGLDRFRELRRDEELADIRARLKD